jgi:hypothetical protein
VGRSFSTATPDYATYRSADGKKRKPVYARIPSPPQVLERPICRLLNRAANLRENSAGVGPDQPHHAHDDYKDDCQHDRVFSDILSFIVPAKAV